jgi:tetratricopeptide (TPR) repeat protein
MLAKKPYFWAFLSLAKLRRKLGQPNESRELLERGAKLDPEPHLLRALGQALIDAKEYSRAEQVLREALTKAPQLPEANDQLSCGLARAATAPLVIHMT